MKSFSSLEHAAVLKKYPVVSRDYVDGGILVTPNISDLVQLPSVMKGGI